MDIEQGQQVLSATDDGLSQDYSSNEVGTKIIIGEASLVQLVLLYDDGETETINTTDEHPFHVAATNTWTRADQLLIGDHLSTITGTAKLQSVIYTTERVPVYNLSIPGSPTYYVGEHGVWVHNATCKPKTPSKIRGNKRANKVSKDWGYEDAHDLKRSNDALPGSEWDIFKDKSDGSLWLTKKAKDFDEWIKVYRN